MPMSCLTALYSTLLAGEATIRDAEKALRGYQAGVNTLSEDELWAARRLKESAVHPDTGEIIPRPFRMSGYVPYNGPVGAAMLISSSTPALMFWNWVNQTQNALVNYFNRNAASPTTNQVLGMIYLGAVGSALAVAFGTSQVPNACPVSI